MTHLSVWSLEWGRSRTETAFIGADTFAAAVKLSISYIKAEKPDWKEVDQNDIRSLKRLDQMVVIP